jgi:DNA-binding PadR family transcriptional regulator
MDEDRKHRADRPANVEFRHYTYCRPAVLVLLSEYDSHGYELVERLDELGFASRDARDSATIYRLLRSMEKEGLTRSSWDVSKVGPPRRVYAITPEGQRLLRDSKVALVRQRDALNALLARYEAVADIPSDTRRALSG